MRGAPPGSGGKAGTNKLKEWLPDNTWLGLAAVEEVVEAAEGLRESIAKEAKVSRKST